MKKDRREQLRARVREHSQKIKQSSFQQQDFIKLPEGVTFFRPPKSENSVEITMSILPFVVQKDNEEFSKGDRWYEREFHLHRKIGPKEIDIICPKETVGKRCPICEEVAKLKAAGYEKNKAMIDALRPSKRLLYNVINWNDKDPQIQLMNIAFFKSLGKLIYDEIEAKDDNKLFFDLDAEYGKDLEIRFVADSFKGNKFMNPSKVTFVRRKESIDDSVLDQTIDLTDTSIFKIYSYEDIEKMFLFLDEDDTEGIPTEEEEKPSKGGRFLKRPTKVEEPEEEEEQDIEEEEEEVKPKKKLGRPKKTKPAPEPEPEKEEDEDEDEDDEPTPPKRGTKFPPLKKHKKVEEEEPEEDEDEDEDEEEQPRQKSLKNLRKKKEKEEEIEVPWNDEGEEETPDECPYGHTFGKDVDQEDECYDCDLYHACKKASKSSPSVKKEKADPVKKTKKFRR